MKFRRFVVWLMISSFLLARTEAFAQSHEQGVAAGTAANAVIRGLVNAPSATAVVPGYTNAPPETAYAGRPSLGTDANARLAACALAPDDPTCQALLNAVNSANTPRQAIGANDPTVAAASRIARNPSLDLGDLSGFYSGCVTATTAQPAGMQTRHCSRHVGAGNYSCTRNLDVDVTRTPSCDDGHWFTGAGDGTASLAVQCLPNRTAANQHFRVTYPGIDPLFFDYSLAAPSVFPVKTRVMGTHIDPVIGAIDISLFLVDNHCVGDACSITGIVTEDVRHICDGGSCQDETPFLPVYSPCPAGTLSGDKLWPVSFCILCQDTPTLDERFCYAPYTKDTPPATPKLVAIDATGIGEAHGRQEAAGEDIEQRGSGEVPAEALDVSCAASGLGLERRPAIPVVEVTDVSPGVVEASVGLGHGGGGVPQGDLGSRGRFRRCGRRRAAAIAAAGGTQQRQDGGENGGVLA